MEDEAAYRVVQASFSASHPIARPNSLSKSANSLSHRLWSRSRKGRAEEQVFGRLVVLCRKPGASSDKDTLLDAQVEDFLFYVGNAALTCVRVEVIVDPEPLLEGRKKSRRSVIVNRNGFQWGARHLQTFLLPAASTRQPRAARNPHTPIR